MLTIWFSKKSYVKWAWLAESIWFGICNLSQREQELQEEVREGSEGRGSQHRKVLRQLVLVQYSAIQLFIAGDDENGGGEEAGWSLSIVIKNKSVQNYRNCSEVEFIYLLLLLISTHISRIYTLMLAERQPNHQSLLTGLFNCDLVCQYQSITVNKSHIFGTQLIWFDVILSI